MAERRKYTRLQINLPVTYTIPNPAGDAMRQGKGVAWDVSPDGILVESNEAIPPTCVRIRAFISAGFHIETTAEAVYSYQDARNRYRTGCQFDDSIGDTLRLANAILKPDNGPAH